MLYSPTPDPANLENKAISPVLSSAALTQASADHEGPVLDQNALIGIAGKFVDLACRNSEASPAAVLVTFLVRTGVEIGPTVKMEVGDTLHYARIFAVIVGATSKARKGTSAKPIDKLFEKLPRPAVKTPGPLSSGEGLIYQVRDPGDSAQNELDPGVEDKRLYVIDEEFGSALAASKRKGNTLSTIIRAAWDDGNIAPLTKTDRISTTNAHIGIVTHITGPELSEKFSSTEFYSGFANRFLWFFSARQRLVQIPKPMPEDQLSELRSELQTILVKAKHIALITFDPASETLWTEKYPELSDDHPGLVGAIINRGEAQVLRIAMIYCILDGKDQISVNHLRAAFAVWQYCVDSANHIWGDRSADAITQKIMEGLKDGPLDRTSISKIFSNHQKKTTLDLKLEELEKLGKVIVVKDTSTGGAPKITYRLAE